MKNKFRFPPEYDSQFEAMVQRVAVEHRSSVKKLTPFWPACGVKYPSSPALVIVGRAVNGLEEERNCWTPSEMTSAEKRSELVSGLRMNAEQRPDCPLAWVMPTEGEGYNPNRAAFWRLGRLVYQSLCDEDMAHWSSHICWTNLFKLSPFVGGNPSTRLMRSQEPFSIELLRLEITAWNPDIVLVLTGEDWFRPFAKSIGIVLTPQPQCQYVQQVGSSGSRLWVVGKHPRGKPEQEFLSEIVQAVKDNTGSASA
jgi:hypothetical protein